MLKLNDGRNGLFQWDTGRSLSVTEGVSQVHFSNNPYGRSIDVEVKNGVAFVPDILLQTDKPIYSWAFVSDQNGGYTKSEKVFPVERRNKPADYVYTPTDQTSLEEIRGEVNQIKKDLPQVVANSVNKYFGQNNIFVKVEEQSFTEDEKNQARKNIGAMSEIGDPKAIVTVAELIVRNHMELHSKETQSIYLKNDTAKGDTMTVAFESEDGPEMGPVILHNIAEPEHPTDATPKSFVERLFDKVGGGIEVSGAEVGQFLKVAAVDGKGVPTAWETVDPPAGGGGTWRQIADLDIAEDCSKVVITEDMNGKQFKATAYYILLKSAIPTDETWTEVRKIAVAPWTSKQVEALGAGNVNSVWHSSLFVMNSGITNKATAVTSSSAYIAVGKGMAFAHAWTAYNNGSLPDALTPIDRNATYFYETKTTEKVLQKPYSDALQFDGSGPCFSAGSKLKIWAIDYVGEE